MVRRIRVESIAQSAIHFSFWQSGVKGGALEVETNGTKQSRNRVNAGLVPVMTDAEKRCANAMV